jgi:hypothetical protein
MACDDRTQKQQTQTVECHGLPLSKYIEVGSNRSYLYTFPQHDYRKTEQAGYRGV